MSVGREVVVVGGGIAGLTAAHDLSAAGLDVLLLEADPELGGKLRRREVAGVLVDVGAEAMLNRRPEGVELARSLGLEVVHPTDATSRVWTRGELRPLPRSLMGVPLDLDELTASGVLSGAGLARVRAEEPRPVEGEVSVRELVGSRLGEEVVDRLVEPLLGGVYAGHAAALSARATVPQLVALAERGRFLDARLEVDERPLFAGLTGGMAGLAEALGGGQFEIRTGVRVTDLASLRAQAIVLATPAPATARLLREMAPVAAAELAAVEYASTVVVTLAFRAADVPDRGLSGFLVPPVEGRTIKAATFSFAKWDWVRAAGDGVVLLRTSLGRHREERILQATDEDLVAGSLADLRTAAGVTAVPVDTHVQRWGGGLPQYALGHLERVARIRAEVARVPGLAVCGAAYDGVGIAAVVGSAHRAAAEVAAHVTMES